MTTQQDFQVGIKQETTFATPVTPDHFVEFLNEDFNWIPEFASGMGMKTGRRVLASSRRTLVKEESNGTLEVECITKGLGILFGAALGTGTSTLISGTAYQQLFTVPTTDYLNSYTIQLGAPLLGGGAAAPQTYAGMVCSGFELTAGNAAIPTLKTSWLGNSMDTSTALATASYPASTELFSFAGGQIVVGGAIVAPTTTTLATGGTAVANIRDFSFAFDNALDSNGFNFNNSGKRSRKPAVGLSSGTGNITAEYTDNTLRDAWRAQTDLGIVLTFKTTTIISGALNPTLQVYIPDVRLEGEMPKANAGDVIAQSIPFTMLNGGVTASPLYISIITAETAI